MQKRKVLHIIDRSSYDGAVVLCKRIMESLPEFDHQIVSCMKGSASEEIQNIGIVCTDLINNSNISIKNRLKKFMLLMFFLKRKRYGRIHFHTGGLGLLLIAYLFRADAKVIFHIHSGNISGHSTRKELFYWQKKILQYLDKKIIKIAVANHIIETYHQQVYKNSDLYFVRNFTGFQFKSVNKQNNSIGYLGRIIVDKNFMLFYEIADYIKHTNPEINFIIKGDTYCSHGEFNKIRNLLTYEKPSFDIKMFLEEINILIFTSTAQEGIPLVILEALAFDIPVVALKSKAVSEILGDYPLLVESNTAKYFAEKIIELYSSKINRGYLSKLHQKIYSRYNYSDSICQIKDIYLNA